MSRCGITATSCITTHSCFYSDRWLVSNADVYISPDDLEESSSLTKRQVLQSLNTTIFISIEGQSGINNFTLNTTYGDTAQPTTSTSAQLTTTHLQVCNNV